MKCTKLVPLGANIINHSAEKYELILFWMEIAFFFLLDVTTTKFYSNKFILLSNFDGSIKIDLIFAFLPLFLNKYYYFKLLN
jgi:hypothetical protein